MGVTNHLLTGMILQVGATNRMAQAAIKWLLSWYHTSSVPDFKKSVNQSQLRCARLTFRKRKKKYKGLIKDESLNQRYKLLIQESLGMPMAAIRRKARSTCAFMVELEAKSGSGKLCWKQKSQSIRAFKLELKS